MSTVWKNQFYFWDYLNRILINILILILLVFAFGCKSSVSENKTENKIIMSQNDSIKANLIDPVILYKRAEGYFANGKFQQASNTLNQIINYYNKNSKDSLIVVTASRLLNKVDRAIDPLKPPERTKENIANELTAKKDIIGAYKQLYGKPDSESDFVSGSYKSKTLIWHCAGGKYRSVDFKYTNGIWYKESEYTSECI